jgi:hypothetical protein
MAMRTPNLTGPLSHGIGKHAEGPDGSQCQGEEREQTQKSGGHALTRNGIGQHFIERLNVVDRLRGVDREDGIAQNWREGFGI